MIQIKLIIAGIIATLIAVTIGVVVWQHHEVTSLTQATATDKVTIADQAQSVSEAHATVVTEAKSAAITEQTQVRAASEVAAAAATTTTIATTRQTKEQAIEAAYAQIPGAVKGSKSTKTTTTSKPAAKVITIGKTSIDTSKTSERDALASVRLASMWQTYCQLNQDQADPIACLANQ
jgi:hypothetical protein